MDHRFKVGDWVLFTHGKRYLSGMIEAHIADLPSDVLWIVRTTGGVVFKVLGSHMTQGSEPCGL